MFRAEPRVENHSRPPFVEEELINPQLFLKLSQVPLVIGP
jgi:hypothetical protein